MWGRFRLLTGGVAPRTDFARVDLVRFERILCRSFHFGVLVSLVRVLGRLE